MFFFFLLSADCERREFETRHIQGFVTYIYLPISYCGNSSNESIPAKPRFRHSCNTSLYASGCTVLLCMCDLNDAATSTIAKRMTIIRPNPPRNQGGLIFHGGFKLEMAPTHFLFLCNQRRASRGFHEEARVQLNISYTPKTRLRKTKCSARLGSLFPV